MEKLAIKLFMFSRTKEAAGACGIRLAVSPAFSHIRAYARAIIKKEARGNPRLQFVCYLSPDFRVAQQILKTLRRAPVYYLKLELFNYCSVRLNIRKTVPKNYFLFHLPETIQLSFLQWINEFCKIGTRKNYW